jgi:hypothetical protein
VAPEIETIDGGLTRSLSVDLDIFMFEGCDVIGTRV